MVSSGPERSLGSRNGQVHGCRRGTRRPRRPPGRTTARSAPGGSAGALRDTVGLPGRPVSARTAPGRSLAAWAGRPVSVRTAVDRSAGVGADRGGPFGRCPAVGFRTPPVEGRGKASAGSLISARSGGGGPVRCGPARAGLCPGTAASTWFDPPTGIRRSSPVRRQVPTQPQEQLKVSTMSAVVRRSRERVAFHLLRSVRLSAAVRYPWS